MIDEVNLLLDTENRIEEQVIRDIQTRMNS